jgi:hypothetical protein
MVVNSASALLSSITPGAGETFTVVIDPDTALEEIVDVISPSAPGSNTLTITRGTGVDGTTAISHSAGAKVRHMAIGRDFREANNHIENTTTAHGLTLANVTLSTGTGNVSTAMLASNAVTTAKITDANVTTAKIADSAITSAKIADLTIATGDIADSAITSGKIATGAVGTTKIDDLSITEGKIVSNAVTTAKIADSAITSAKIADGTIVAGDIADGAITSAKILDGTIATGDIADSAVTSAKIADGTIVAGDLADGAVTSAKILNDTIVNADINSSAQIAYGKLALTNTIVDADVNASAAIALSKLATDPLARANHTGTQTASTISDFDTQVRTSKVTDLAAPTGSFSMNSQKITNLATPTSSTDAVTKAYADTMIPAAEKGAVNGVATLGSDGKLTTAQIPDVTITDTFVVSSQAAMLALTAQVGDVAVRTDLNKSFILRVAGASTLANWQELLTPTDSVLSVDGQTGAVDLSSTYATVANAANKLPLAGGTMSGAIAMGTNKITGAGDPTSAQDVATKNYVDTAAIAPSNLTGPITSVGPATSIASQTGTGTKFVMDNSPTLITPNIGVATATSINGTTIPSSKTLVATDSTQYVVPSQTGNTGKFLTTDGSVSSWAPVDALPSQTGNAGEFLTTDGTTASWAVVAGSLAQPTEPTSPTDGQIWVDTDGTALINQLLRWSKAPANGTTTLSGNDDNSVPLTYSVGYEQVFQNGALLARGSDYTATNGTSISLTNASVTGDIFEVFAAQPVAISDVYTQTQANAAFINDSLLTTTGDTIYASGANTPARLGIGTTGQVLTVSGGVPTWATASAGGMTELASGSITTTVTLSNIAQTYNELWLYVSNAYSGSANSFYLSFNNVTTGAKYSQLQQFADGITTSVGSGTASGGWNTANAGIDINATDWLANTSGNHYIIRIPNYTSSANKVVEYSVNNFSTGGTNRGIKRGTIAFYESTAISRIDLGNATSGTYKLFGVK